MLCLTHYLHKLTDFEKSTNTVTVHYVCVNESVGKPAGVTQSCSSYALDLKRNAYLAGILHATLGVRFSFLLVNTYQVPNSFNLCLNSLQGEVHGLLLKKNISVTNQSTEV